MVEGSILDPAALRETGGAEEGTRNVIACSGSARLVLFSSSSVYAHAGAHPVDEGDTADADELLRLDGGVPGYASGKWRLETHGRAAAQEGRRVTVVRPFNVVGSRQTGRYGMVAPTLVKRALAGAPLPEFDDGEQSRCFSDVGTFVRVLGELAERDESWPDGGLTLNVGADRPTRIGELSRIILEETRSASPVEHVDHQEVFPGRRDVRARVPDTRRCDALVGAVEWPDARDIVRGVVNWMRSECTSYRLPDPGRRHRRAGRRGRAERTRHRGGA